MSGLLAYLHYIKLMFDCQEALSDFVGLHNVTRGSVSDVIFKVTVLIGERFVTHPSGFCDNNDNTFDSGSHINNDVTDVINVILWSAAPDFSFVIKGCGSPAAQGLPPRGGMPCAMLAFTKYPLREASRRTAVFTRFSDQFFGNGFLYCAKTFKKLLLKKYIAKRKMQLPFRRKRPCNSTLCMVLYI